ncbi:hypothetical protein R6Q59_025453 [Mikania micrantha]
MTIIDNICQNTPSSTGREGLSMMCNDIGKIPYQYRSIFGQYLELVGHSKSSQIQQVQPNRLRLKWSTSKNTTDCGIFLMRHMESYKGQYVPTWDCGFEAEGRKQTTQIRQLRYKYAAKLLLSDINLHKDEALVEANLISKELERRNKLEMEDKDKYKKTSDETAINTKRKK